MAARKKAGANPIIAARALKLRKVQTQVNLLRGALHELSMDMNGPALPFHPDAWPGVDDPDLHVTVMRRLIDLAEVVHAVGVAAEHLGSVDTRGCARSARRLVQSYGHAAGEGRFIPGGREGAAAAKDMLLARIQKILDDPAHASRLPDALAQSLGRWFFMEAQGGGGAHELTVGLKWTRSPIAMDAGILATLKRTPAEDLRDPEKVIKVVWRALGASSAVVRNLFSYRDHRK